MAAESREVMGFPEQYIKILAGEKRKEGVKDKGPTEVRLDRDILKRKMQRQAIAGASDPAGVLSIKPPQAAKAPEENRDLFYLCCTQVFTIEKPG